MASLKEKMKDPTTADQRPITGIRKQSRCRTIQKQCITYIQGLKDDILKKAGGDPNNPDKSYKEDNLDIATRKMVEKGGGKKLLAKT